MDAQGAREFARREWAAQEEAKRAHWAAVYREQGWRAVWDAAQALFVHMRSVNPAFPADDGRAEDLEHHRALKDRIDRAADAFARH